MGYIHSIQTFGTVDGPGVRFVVFLQGCPLRCQYCHNPDTWNLSDGKEKTTDEIIDMFERNRTFYTTGGITATGGEPMMQMDFLLELFTKAKERDIHTCLDTSGIMFTEDSTSETFAKIEALMEVTDLVMLDIKHMDAKEHEVLTGQSNDKILAFAKYLEEKKKPVWIRHVVVPGITFEEAELTQLGEFLKTLTNVEKLEVLPYHSIGEVKYEKLGMNYVLKGTPQLTKEEAAKAEEIVYKAWGRTKNCPAKEHEKNTDEKSGGIVCRTC